MTDAGTVYDAFRRTNTLPSSDAGGDGTRRGAFGDLTATYFENDLVSSLSQPGGSQVTYTLDKHRRLDRTNVGAIGRAYSIQHYSTSAAGGNEAASWVELIPVAGNISWSRDLASLDGLGGTLIPTVAGPPVLSLTA